MSLADLSTAESHLTMRAREEHAVVLSTMANSNDLPIADLIFEPRYNQERRAMSVEK